MKDVMGRGIGVEIQKLLKLVLCCDELAARRALRVNNKRQLWQSTLGATM